MASIREAHQGWVNSGRSGRSSTDALLEAIVEHLVKEQSREEFKKPKKD